jgi:hypothetical protein
MNRRRFIGSAAAVASAATIATGVPRAAGSGAATTAVGTTGQSSLLVNSSRSSEFGHKGKIFPDQRRKYKDAKTGHTVWQMTDTPGHFTRAQYATQPMATPDSRFVVYGSDRAGELGQWNLFKLDLQTGESTQLTESTRHLVYRWSVISPDGKEVYYVEDGNSFKVVNLDSLEERELCRVTPCYRPHQLTVSPDNKYIINPIFFEPKEEENFLVGNGHLIRSALVVINTKTGEIHRLCDGNTPRTHAQYCPTDPNLIMYCYGGPWWYVQRLWMIQADGTGNRPIFIQSHFEGAGHEFWGTAGKTIYVFCNGGRQPQGLWAVNSDGTNERCVMAGPCTGHGSVNHQEDRFVASEIFGNATEGLWMSKKGSTQPELLVHTGYDPSKFPSEIGASPHPRFLPDSKRLIFSSAMTGSPEVYMVEV